MKNDSLSPPSAGNERMWTPEQLLGIETIGRSLLVSAAAGSGKTSVLAARCVHLVCDATPPCNIDELLVVTFTEAAAREMKDRIITALRKRADESPSPRLAEQLALVDQAQVSTLHAFCARLLRQHFHLVGLDPGFVVLEGDEALLLRRETCRQLFDDRFEEESGAGGFHALVDAYGESDDARVMRSVLHVHELLTSVVDRQGWLAHARERIEEAATVPLDESELGRKLQEIVKDGLAALRHRCADSVARIRQLRFGQYADYLAGIGATIGYWSEVFADGGIDALAEVVADPQWPKLPTVKGDAPGKELARSLVESVRTEAKEGSWRDCLRFSTAQWHEGLAKVLPHAEIFLGLIEQFGRRYADAKAASRCLDFADLERFSLQALRKTSDFDPTEIADQSGTGGPPVAGRARPALDLPGRQPQERGNLSRQSVPPTEKRTRFDSANPRSLSDVMGGPPMPRKAGASRSIELEASDCARAYHRRFAHVLVDEYQDINEVQDAILTLVSRECVAREPRVAHNLFCVGDVKQSIYRFRLAEPARFLEKQGRFESANSHGRVIDLQANFRSRGPLLEAINSVFHLLMTAEAADIEYDESHRLHAMAGYPAPDDPRGFAGAPIELHLLPSKMPAGQSDSDDCDEGAGDEEDLERLEREAVLAAREIRRIVGMEGQPARLITEKDTAGQFVQRDATFRDIVVLLRAMKYKAEQFADVLRAGGVPVHAEAGTGYFEAMEVRDMLALLQLLDNQRQDIPLAAVLRSPLGQLPEPDTSLARIRLAYRADESERHSGAAPGVAFHEAATRYAGEKHDALAARLVEFFAQLERWRTDAQRRPLADVIWSIYQQSGYLAFVAGLANGEQRVANLKRLHERAVKFGAFQSRGLSRFLRYLEQLREESDLGQPSIASEAENVVRVMSIHRAKGREFPVVVLPDLGKRINLRDCQGGILADRQAGLGMVVVDEAKRCRYPSLASTLVRARLRQQSLAEELRVLYVAMTRAKEHLVMIGTCDEKKPAQWESLWRDHAGVLPPDTVLGARTMLDWLGPVSIATRGEPHDVFVVTLHSPDDVRGWPSPSARQRQMTGEQLAMARLEPLAPKPPVPDAAARAIERLSFVYPYRAYSELPATRSVTADTHLESSAGTKHARGAGTPRGAGGPPMPLQTTAAPAKKDQISESDSHGRDPTYPGIGHTLPAPKFLMKTADLSAADRGSATHAALEHLNFAGACDAADIARQIEAMVERHILWPAEAASVRRDWIHWLLGSEIGRLLRREPRTVRREVSIYYPSVVKPESPAAISADPLDRVMIRGRVDVLIVEPDGTTIIDYKTDAIGVEDVEARARMYEPQMRAYREAIQRITGKSVKQAYLVFLAMSLGLTL
ncbi:MAG TPA: UvrD-helicase domain-containing protein [Tepidisphaeraceae bacterium]|nr:UvrD-helicase domain-containing protein [Tepidisphaeraceae bacterium]